MSADSNGMSHATSEEKDGDQTETLGNKESSAISESPHDPKETCKNGEKKRNSIVDV